MPQLIYFKLQGRAQMTRYALTAGGIEFEDKHLTGEEWGPIKAAETYGKGVQLPVLILDDGKILNQSIAILKYAAHLGGFVPKSAQEEFECAWFFEQDADLSKKEGLMVPFFNGEADEAAIDKTVAAMKGAMEALDARFADGRKHVAGENVTAADFRLLTIGTSVVGNKDLKIPALGEKLREMAGGFENIQRVMNNAKALPGIEAAIETAAGLQAWI